jgi:two-component sensor histidine kinase
MPLREAEEMASVGRFASSLEKVTSDAPWKPYALALAAVFTALLVREVLAAILGINLFAVFFLPAVMVTGLACGIVPGIFAAVLATFVPLIHVVADTSLYFPSQPNMLMNLAVIGVINIGLAIVGASHRTYRKRVELAMRELNHRTKNLLAVIAGVANNIARYTSDVDSFKQSLGDRLQAISRSTICWPKTSGKTCLFFPPSIWPSPPFPATIGSRLQVPS